MFTGLTQQKGFVSALQKNPGGARFSVRAPGITVETGESIAVNGCCVTVVAIEGETFTVDLVPDTLARTNLGLLQIGAEVNLERAMQSGDRFGGHLVQGHIDCLGQVRSRRKVGTEELLEITIPFEVSRFIVAQGSIAIDGVSLTVVEAGKDRVKVALIPYTREMTTLGELQPMDVVNLELDVLAKYVDKHVQAYMARLPRFMQPEGESPSSTERSSSRDRESRPRDTRSTERYDRPRAEREEGERRPSGVWRARDDERPKRSYGDRDDRPKRTFAGRDDRPKRTFSDRDDRPKRTFSDRDDRPKRTFAARDDRPKRTFSDRDDRPGRPGRPTGGGTGRRAVPARATVRTGTSRPTGTPTTARAKTATGSRTPARAATRVTAVRKPAVRKPATRTAAARKPVARATATKAKKPATKGRTTTTRKPAAKKKPAGKTRR